MMAPWAVTPVVAAVAILGFGAVARLERTGKSRSVITAVTFVLFLILMALLLLSQNNILEWTIGLLIGVGVGYSVFFHRNARRSPQGGPPSQSVGS